MNNDAPLMLIFTTSLQNLTKVVLLLVMNFMKVTETKNIEQLIKEDR